MKTSRLYFFLIGLLILGACSPEDTVSTKDSNEAFRTSNSNLTDYFAVANRGAGTVSIYDAKNTNRMDDIVMSGSNAAPTYVTYSKERDVLYVADFNNPRVVAYNVSDFSEADDFQVGNGAFHMWIHDGIDQLWVNNLMDKTTSVVNLNTGMTMQTIQLPMAMELPMDAVQHDVIISPDGNYAYVSVLSTVGNNYVLQYSTGDFSLINYTIAGGDPHLTVTDDYLYILSQNDSTILEYNFTDLTPTGKGGMIPNAHGVTPGDMDDILVTNIPERKIAVYNSDTEVVDRVTDAGSTSGVAHNAAFNPRQNILALTLSGSNTVDFFRVTNKKITYLSSDVSGINPFGIVYVER